MSSKKPPPRTPYLTIDLAKIEHNARVICDLCRRHGIEVVGVTKATRGHPQVAEAMLRGGVRAIGESRLTNIHRLRAAGVPGPFMLLREPSLSMAEAVVEAANLSLNSEFAVIAALSEAAHRRRTRHDVILMVDLGDLREGLWPDELISLVAKVRPLPGIRLAGVGTNLSCYGGVLPSEANMGRLAALADEVEKHFGLTLPILSGGNSSALKLIAAGKMPRRVNQVRIGEAILLGRETTHREPWPDTFQDAFLLHAEVIELKWKPSVPLGDLAEDAFGQTHLFIDQGIRLRALLKVGRQDVDIAGIRPLEPAITVLGGSSDYLIVDATARQGTIALGDLLAFSLDYSALLAAMTSDYVEKRLLS